MNILSKLSEWRALCKSTPYCGDEIRDALPLAIEALEIAVKALANIREIGHVVKSPDPEIDAHNIQAVMARECLAALNELFGDK